MRTPSWQQKLANPDPFDSTPRPTIVERPCLMDYSHFHASDTPFNVHKPHNTSHNEFHSPYACSSSNREEFHPKLSKYLIQTRAKKKNRVEKGKYKSPTEGGERTEPPYKKYNED